MFRAKRLIKSFKYAIHGFSKTFKEEQNLQLQSIAGIAVLLVAWFFHIERIEWIILIFLIGIVLLLYGG